MRHVSYKNQRIKNRWSTLHSVIGGMCFAMGCHLALSSENAVGVLLLTIGAFLLGTGLFHATK